MEAIRKARPAAAKGNYIKHITVATTMGPGIKIDPSAVQSLEVSRVICSLKPSDSLPSPVTAGVHRISDLISCSGEDSEVTSRLKFSRPLREKVFAWISVAKTFYGRR